jgi:cytochrome c-type biogenesis protein
MVSGLSAAELEADGDGATPSQALRPVLRGIGLFVAGFTIVFVALGATASGLGQVLHSNKVTLTYISGAVIVFLGVVMLLGALPATVWSNAGSGTLGLVSRVTGEHRFDVRPSRLGKWAAPVMGMAFAFAWTPCVGPVLGVVLGLASRTDTLAGGVVLLFAYSLGLAVPFVLVGLAFQGAPLALGGGARRGTLAHRVRGDPSDRQHRPHLEPRVELAQRHRAWPAHDQLKGGASPGTR